MRVDRYVGGVKVEGHGMFGTADENRKAWVGMSGLLDGIRFGIGIERASRSDGPILCGGEIDEVVVYPTCWDCNQPLPDCFCLCDGCLNHPLHCICDIFNPPGGGPGPGGDPGSGGGTDPGPGGGGPGGPTNPDPYDPDDPDPDDPDDPVCATCQQNPCICLGDITIALLLSHTEVEVLESHVMQVVIMANMAQLPAISAVSIWKRRQGVTTGGGPKAPDDPGTGHYMVQNFTNPGGNYLFMTDSRTSLNPGIWEVEARVKFSAADFIFKDTQILTVNFPERSKFSSVGNSAAVSLWNSAVTFASDNRSTHAVREYGRFIMLNPNGAYTLADVPPGPIVQLNVAGAHGSILFDEGALSNIHDPDRQIPIAVGTAHSHYPLTWAATGFRIANPGPSGADNNCFWPGFVYDYTNEVRAGNPVDIPNNPKIVHPHGPNRRTQWAGQILPEH